jgi:hypothetical protein
VAEGAEASACMIAMFEVVVRRSSGRRIVALAPFVVRRRYAVEEQIKEEGIENFWPFARE